MCAISELKHAIEEATHEYLACLRRQLRGMVYCMSGILLSETFLTYAMLPYAAVCGRMLTYADVC
jgi:hypothetical protein